MFERFSKEAREAVTRAQTIAHDAGSRSIDTRHVTIALARMDGPAATGLRAAGVSPEAIADALLRTLHAEGLDAEALAFLGVNLDAVRSQSDAIFGPGALDRAGRPAGHLRFERDAKKALELALRECIRLGMKRIDGRHLLLGILRADSAGRAALAAAGGDLTALRQTLEAYETPEARSA